MRNLLTGAMALGGFLLAKVAYGATLASTTLGTTIDSMNTTAYDYVVVLIDKLWPFVLALGVLIAVWYIGRRAIRALR